MKSNKILLLLFVALIAMIILSLQLGRYNLNTYEILLNLKEFLYSCKPSDERNFAVVNLVRLPRILFAILVGAALASSGAIYQGLFKNPLVSPDILGVTSGAAVGASLAIILSLPSYITAISAFLFGILAVFLVVFVSISISKGRVNLLIMILVGIVISSLFSSFAGLIKYLADSEDRLPQITFWLMGSLSRTGNFDNLKYMFAIATICFILLLLLRHKINILSLDENEAKSMGLDVRIYSFFIILISTLLCAICTAFCGIIGWVGLVVPHMVRFIVGSNFSILLPASMLVGGLFLLIIDTIARTILIAELPLSILTSLFGAPIFVYLLYKNKKGAF